MHTYCFTPFAVQRYHTVISWTHFALKLCLFATLAAATATVRVAFHEQT